MCRATVKGREMLGKHVGQTAWQNTLADIFVNHLCRRCWPLPLPGGFALMWPGVLSIPRPHQVSQHGSWHADVCVYDMYITYIHIIYIYTRMINVGSMCNKHECRILYNSTEFVCLYPIDI